MAANKTNFLEDFAQGGADYSDDLFAHPNPVNKWGGNGIVYENYPGPNGDMDALRVVINSPSSYVFRGSVNIGNYVGKKYKCQIWIKSNTGTNQTIKIVVGTSDGWQTYIGIIQVTPNWNKYVIYDFFNTNEGNGTVKWQIMRYNADVDVLVWDKYNESLTYHEILDNGKHGMLREAVDIDQFWASSPWATIDGVNDRVEIGDVLNPGTSNAIYMLWTKIPSGQTSRAILSKWRDLNAGFSIETSANGRLLAKVSDGINELATVDDGPVITDNNPRIVAVVIDRLAKKLKRYVADANGVQKIGTDLDISTLGSITNNFNFLIGARDNATQDGFINMQFGMAPQYIFPDDAMMVNNAYESQIIGYFLNHTKGIYL